MRICVIVNPRAGPGTFKRSVQKAIKKMIQMGGAVELAETTSKGHATILARQAATEGFDVVVAVGGDGTINEICNGLAETDTALAVMPAGTGNVYAADMKIPIWSPLKPDAVTRTAKIVMNGQRRKVDLGRLHLPDGTSRYFLMWCGIGLDAAITQAKQPAKQRTLSYAAWVIAGVIISVDFMGTPATITTDTNVIEERVLMALVSNSQLYGRIWRVAPKAKMDDGLLDVAVMTGHGLPSTIRHIVGLTFKQHVKDPKFHLYRTTHLSLSAKDTLPVHVDGETISNTPVEIDIAPKALNIIVPHKAPKQLFIP